MNAKKITLICEVPGNITNEELKKFLLFKYHGHSIDGEILSKFKHEELDVDSFKIEDY